MERTQRGDILDLDFGQGRIVPVNLEHEMKNSYIDYAMSVIVARALPDVRDGLKPVHRRILYAMQGSGMTSSKPYKKSARITHGLPISVTTARIGILSIGYAATARRVLAVRRI